ncbi:MAG: hypothetical protein A3H01_01610 [Candidatus Wildermuthbacteria bacterium RIFCSPLOWO2_12_FULL_40_9]|uniref:O-antigen ligase-related domain-containing protein n=2 Tax=Candidatus Wildermuthiibacteriota TaxID=1817923 RepID=A0A1G2RFK0_9BACT|nr:MAG: hypothetical protein A3F15_01650 [Candidatus Wildermuthbacteria bacterium RIFCSPHIGHO2_12_FULL_40_12]OHA76414.1 MAG: hypothetical protein A3H01_01610 [Candidatus Wildermuthbacteria bacterium RIFCSPLOWO2_12_FULL_40_9]
MQEKKRISNQNNFYWAYLIGFFFIVAQIINVLPFWTMPNDWGKAIFFRIALSLMIFLFLFQIFFEKISLADIRNKIKTISLPFYLLVTLFGIYLLATLFSVNPHFSLWGDPLRNGGFINFSFYIFLAILAFLIIKKSDWQKLLNFLIIVSVLVCIIALFQKFGIFNKYLIPFESRPISTLGNPLLLSLYLVLVTFITLVLGLSDKNRYKKIFYFSSFFLFLFVNIVLVQTRGAYLGLIAGFLWFFFFYPIKSKKIKIYALIVLIVATLGMYFSKIYLDSHLYLYEKIPPTLSSALDRALSIFEGSKITEARTSVWKVSLQALKEKPILGWGPENFVVAFDKHYDPSLPKIGRITPGDNVNEWFDRAHSFIFDVSITGGIFAFLIYLLFFFFLIWQLQKTKQRNPEISLISHGLQATFLAYLVSLASSFDSVSTYLVSFLLIGYSFYLISENNLTSKKEEKKPLPSLYQPYKYKIPITFFIFIVLIWFLWSFNLKPLYINKEMNVALALADLRMETTCEKALEIVDRISPSIENSIINNYLGQKSTFVIYGCNDKIKSRAPEALIRQNIEILEKNIDKNPQYVTNWILIGEYTSILIKERNRLNENIFVETEETKKLKDEANQYFQKALELSPKRQVVLKDWADLEIATGEYQKAEEKLQKCIDLNASYARCYWYMALNKGYQKDYEGFSKFLEVAREKGILIDSQEFLQDLVNMYIRNSDYTGLTETYPRLISLTLDPLEKAQLHASLAASYQELGNITKAREEVLKILDLIPDLDPEIQESVKKDIEIFLEILQ